MAKKFNYEAARKAGYSDAEIVEFLSGQEAPVPQVQTPAPVSQGGQLAPKQNQGILMSLAQSIVNPARKTAGQAYDILSKSGNFFGNIGSDLAGRKRQQLYNAKDNPFLDQNEQKMLDSGAGNYAKQSLKNTAGIASYGIPFGKGANLLTKALLPGAAAGGLSAASENEASGESILQGILGGAAGAGIVQGGGDLLKKALGKVGGLGKPIQEVGTNLRGNVSKIYEPGSVWGSSREKTIQNTLDSLGIAGNAQNKYESLEPSFKKLSENIGSILTRDKKSIPITDVSRSFQGNLKELLRTREIDNKVAQKEIVGYLRDLTDLPISESDLGLSVNGAAKSALDKLGSSRKAPQINTKDLFDLKKVVNRDFQGVAKKLEKGVPLNDREKIISVARKTIDDVISQYHPDVKKLTLKQSDLFDAAESLNRSRKSVPTFRLFGTSIPAGVSQNMQDSLGEILQVGGKKLGSVGKVAESVPSNNKLLQQILGQASSRLGGSAFSDNVNKNGNETESSNNYATTNSNTNSQKNSVPDQLAPPEDTNNSSGIIPQPQDEQFRITPEMVMQAQLVLSPAEAGKIEAMYKIQEEANPKAKPLTGDQIKQKNKADAGLRALDEVEGLLDADSNIMLKAALPGAFGARSYEAAKASLTDIIGGLRTGASVSKEQQKFYNDLLPKNGDSKETIRKKIQAVREELQSYANQEAASDGMDSLKILQNQGVL